MPNAEPGHPGRPRVVCHMMASVDGRIVTDDWPLSDAERAESSGCTSRTRPTAGSSGA